MIDSSFRLSNLTKDFSFTIIWGTINNTSDNIAIS